MVILLTGASGFLGRSVAAALDRAGHEVRCASRHAPAAVHGSSAVHLAVDYTKDFAVSVWASRLAGVDAVINAAGIFREHAGQTFEAIHVKAPRALFEACASARIRVVQISALGADAGAVSPYHASKREADDFLLEVSPMSVVAQPSVVFGAGGASAALFTTLASMPVVALPGSGDQRIQPIHVEDFTDAIVKLVTSHSCTGLRVPLVGREPVSLRDFIARLRRAMGLRPATVIPVPWGFAKAAARLAGLHPSSLVNADSLAMLARGNTADPSATVQLLGKPPRAVDEFIAPASAAAARASARLGWLLPMLRCSIAIVWIVSGLVSLGLYPIEQSYALLERVGLAGPPAAAALYGAATLDLVFGVATLTMARRRLLWLTQAAVIVVYTFIITLSLPEYWLHPFGPVLKNLPMLAGIWMLYELEEH